MLNYIWAGLILFALIFALTTDVNDLRTHAFANGNPLAATITYHNAADQNTPQAAVDVQIDPADYSNHFHVKEDLAKTYPATISRTEKESILHFSKDGALPPRMAAMRGFFDTKELVASLKTPANTENLIVPAQITFLPVRFVKLRAITTAAIDTAQTAVELAIGLIGALAMWLGLMKIAESSGLIEIMVKIIQPILHPLFPSIPKGHPAMGYIAINLAGNILGLGNATTAMGLKAMEKSCRS